MVRNKPGWLCENNGKSNEMTYKRVRWEMRGGPLDLGAGAQTDDGNVVAGGNGQNLYKQ